MSNDLQWNEIEIPIGGLDQGTDKRILPPGKFVSVINGDFVKPGTIRKRPGISRVCSPFANDFPKGDRIGRWNNQVFTFDPTETVAIHQMNEADETYPQLPPGGLPPIPTATVRASSVNNDLTRDVLADVAVTSNGFLVYGLIGRAGSGGGTVGASVRVVEASSGAVVLEEQVLLSFNHAYVRAAASGDFVLITFSGGTNRIEAIVVDCTTEVPSLQGTGTSPQSAIDLITDLSATWQSHDTAGLTVTTSRWALVYRQTGTDNLKLVELTWSGSFATSSITVDTGTITHPSVIVAGNGQDVVVNYAKLDAAGSGNFRYAVFNETTLATVLAATSWNLVSTVKPLATAIGRYENGPTDDYLLFSSYTRSVTTDSTPITTWCRGNRAGMLGTPSSKRRIFVTGKPWVRGNRQHIWTATRQGISADTYSYTLVLISVPNNPEATYRGIGNTVAGATIETTGFPQAAAAPFVQDTADQQCQPSSYALYDGVYHSCQHVTYVNLEQRIGPVDCLVRYDHLGRYSNVEFGGSTYCTGGVVTQWDGSKLREVGTVHPPNIIADVTLTGGNFSFTGNYSYLAVFEYIDAQTQRHRFLKSNIETVNVANLTDKVEFLIDNLTLTRAQRFGPGSPQEMERVYVTIYRGREATGNLFQRLFQYSLAPDELVNDPEGLNFTTFTDTGDDNDENEPLYTEGGELENDMPYGGATALCVHKDRLWIGGGIDPEIVWYSKPRADGLPAEFSIAQTFRVPGEEIVALGSLDEALIVFCTKGVYAVFGDGPDATGAGRPFDIPVMVNQESACSGPRSVTQIPQGLVFQTRNGIYLLDHKRQVIYLGEPIKDTYKLYPVVKGVANDSARGELLIALSDVAGTAGTVAVYNYLQGLWALWNHSRRTSDGVLFPESLPWADLSVWLNREPVYLSQAGGLYEQQSAAQVYSDDLLFYPLDVETGWLSFGRMQGYKRIRKAGVLLERFNIHGLEISMKFGYNETVAATVVLDQNQITNMGAVEWVRITVPRQKTPALRMRVKEREATIVTEVGQFSDTPGFAIDGFAFQIGMIPGLQRLPASQSG